MVKLPTYTPPSRLDIDGRALEWMERPTRSLIREAFAGLKYRLRYGKK